MAIVRVTRLASAANNTNATLVCAGPCILYGYEGVNAAAAVRHLKFYDLAVAPTVGTTVPKLVAGIAASSRFVSPANPGIYFPSGLGFGIVTGAADNDTTAPTAADIVSLAIYWDIQ